VDRVGLVGLPNSGKIVPFQFPHRRRRRSRLPPFLDSGDRSRGRTRSRSPGRCAWEDEPDSRKIVYAGFEVVDIAAIAKGGEKGDALGGRFLAGVREVDALCLVLRSFEDENVPGDTDPLAALEVVELELALADLATLEQQLTKKRSRVAPLDPAIAAGLKAAPAAIEVLEQGTPFVPFESACRRSRGVEAVLPADDKPTMAVINVGEDELADTHEIVPAVESKSAPALTCWPSRSSWRPRPRGSIPPSALSCSRARPRPGRSGTSRAGGVRHSREWVFLTTGEDESRAWIFRSARKPLSALEQSTPTFSEASSKLT